MTLPTILQTRRRAAVVFWAIVLALVPALASPAPAQQESAQPAKPDETSPAETTPPVTQPATQPAKKPHPRATPRSMVREFLRAVSESDEKPERISDAIKCLDLTQLEREDPEQAKQQAPLLAKQLAQVIDELLNTHGHSLEDIPEPTEETIIRFPKEGPNSGELQRYEDGLWRFSAETVAAIPDYLDATKKAAKELEEDPVEADPTIPQQYLSARATMKTFLAAMEADSAIAGKCLNLQARSAATRTEIGQELADRLLFVMDRIKVVVLQEIPDRPDAEPYSCVFQRKRPNRTRPRASRVGSRGTMAVHHRYSQVHSTALQGLRGQAAARRAGRHLVFAESSPMAARESSPTLEDRVPRASALAMDGNRPPVGHRISARSNRILAPLCDCAPDRKI